MSPTRRVARSSCATTTSTARAIPRGYAVTPEESPYPPSPSRRALHAVVLCASCSVTGARCWALRCEVGNRTPDAARRVTGCDFGSRRLVHAARLLGYRLLRLVD